MSGASDKRRRARVQGGWAGSAGASGGAAGQSGRSGGRGATPGSASATRNGRGTGQRINNSKEPATIPQGRDVRGLSKAEGLTATENQSAKSEMPAWYGRTVDVPESSKASRFTYEAPVEAMQASECLPIETVPMTSTLPWKMEIQYLLTLQPIKDQPKWRTIDKSGVYDISHEPSGTSRLRLFPNYIESARCKNIFEDLFHELPWKQRNDVKNGTTYAQPRLTAWCGDLPYSYSGVTLQPNCHWPACLKELKDNIEENTGCHFNSMLGNLYRDGHDAVAWHADDEPSLGTNPVIASLSFGDLRNFELRRKPPPGSDLESYVSPEYVKIPMEAGTLLIMEGCVQEDWQHRVPREYHDRGPRINLTFRVILPDTRHGKSH